VQDVFQNCVGVHGHGLTDAGATRPDATSS
jgi:hypothetical protein